MRNGLTKKLAAGILGIEAVLHTRLDLYIREGIGGLQNFADIGESHPLRGTNPALGKSRSPRGYF